MSEAHTSTGTEVPSHETEATAFGFLTAPMAISIAMIVVIAILVWKKVPAAIGAALDRKIAAIRDQLAEAESLRKEAEALKAEYVAKAAAAESEAKAMLDRARHEADAMIEKARKDADALVERRGRMAEEKIAAEERAAVQQLRTAVADVATRATARIIAEQVDAKADAALVDSTIKGLGRR
jgi:F-type H+-transporting ATPase subunit b